MNCRESLKKLYEFLDGDLEKVSRREMKKHLDRCRHCWDRIEFEKKLKALLKKSCCKECCPDTLRLRIEALLKKY